MEQLAAKKVGPPNWYSLFCAGKIWALRIQSDSACFPSSGLFSFPAGCRRLTFPERGLQRASRRKVHSFGGGC